MDSPTPSTQPSRTPRDVLILRGILGFVVGALLMFAAWTAYVYAVTPVAIRNPTQQHYHLRLQILNGGKAVNFADSRYQTELNQDICTAKLTKEPFHFHDGLDQFVHVHWDHMTGGLLLKDYGWNFIGGSDSTLGYKFNGFQLPQRVAFHGPELPTPVSGAQYFVYTGDANSYQQRSWNDFLHQDLVKFFGTTGEVHANPDEKVRAELNHVLGSVVIFAQPSKPTDQQVKDRFSKLIPLPESTCSG
jgi:hypothetical protein